MSTIIFLSGRSMNDALGALGRAHRPLFEALGYEFVIVDLSQPDASDLNHAMQRQPIEFAYSAAGMGADIRGKTADGKDVNFWAGNGIPFLSINGDSPAYFFDRHVMPTSWHACLYCYPEHLELRRRLGPSSALCGVVPPFPIDLTARRDVDFRKKEGGKLLFLKNGNDPDMLVQSWQEGMAPATFLHLAELAAELAGSVASEAGCDIDAVVSAYFRDRGWSIEESLDLRLFFVAQLDDYLRRVKSVMVADVLADFPVEIHGFNWEHLDFSGRRAKFVPGGDYTRSRQEILDSLGIIDMSPNTQRAPHDRPLRAFGLYTLCLTNEQQFFREHFANAHEFCYRFDKDQFRAKVIDVLAHPKRYVELGRDVAEGFRQLHQPEDFARFMVDTAGMVRLACGPKPQGFQDFFVWPSMGRR